VLIPSQFSVLPRRHLTPGGSGDGAPFDSFMSVVFSGRAFFVVLAALLFGASPALVQGALSFSVPAGQIVGNTTARVLFTPGGNEQRIRLTFAYQPELVSYTGLGLGSGANGASLAVDATNPEDGFSADSPRASGSDAALARHHSADTRGATSGSPRDGAIDLFDLTRVIELYNTRAGTVCTGAYHVQSGMEDGFAAGP